MDIRGKQIFGLPAIIVRNAFRTFNNQDSSVKFVNGEFKFTPKKLTSSFLASNLSMKESDAENLFSYLISDGYVDPNKHVPTPKGMALIDAEDRDRITNNEAQKIFKKFLSIVKTENSRDNAQIFVEKVILFGSFERGEETVGDIDLVIYLTPPDENYSPEVQDEEEDLCERLLISEYLSFHREFDPVAVNAKGRTVYERNQAQQKASC